MERIGRCGVFFDPRGPPPTDYLPRSRFVGDRKPYVYARAHPSLLPTGYVQVAGESRDDRNKGLYHHAVPKPSPHHGLTK
jgi:hypothetical protein